MRLFLLVQFFDDCTAVALVFAVILDLFHHENDYKRVIGYLVIQFAEASVWSQVIENCFLELANFWCSNCLWCRINKLLLAFNVLVNCREQASDILLIESRQIEFVGLAKGTFEAISVLCEECLSKWWFGDLNWHFLEDLVECQVQWSESTPEISMGGQRRSGYLSMSCCGVSWL